MNEKFKLSLLSASVLLAIAGSATAQSFCGDRTNARGTGDIIWEQDLGANDCIEVSVMTKLINGIQVTYDVGTAQNITIADGGRMNVLGYLKNSSVSSGGEVWINKEPRYAVSDYQFDAPALGTNLNVNAGGLIRVFDGGTLKDSHINEGGRVFVLNEPNGTDDTGKSINNTVNKGGELYVYLGGKSEGTVVNDAGELYVYGGATTHNGTINNGGLQIIYKKGLAYDTIVKSGGTEAVQNDGSQSHNTTVEAGGQQTVANGGLADGAQIYGMQTIYSTSTTNGLAVATNTTVHGSGVQHILKGGKAETVTLLGNAQQSIGANSSAKDVSINNQAQSTVRASGQLLGATQMNHEGKLTLTAAQGTTGAFAENVNFNSSKATLLIKGSGNDTDTATIGQLTGSGQVQFVMADIIPAYASQTYTRLNVDNLSGNMLFKFNTSIADGRGDYLTIGQGVGKHRVSVLDSGAEITDPANTKLDIITDNSAGAGFSLAKADGSATTAVDGGAYMYTLDSRMEGADKVWFLTSNGTLFPIIPVIPGGPGVPGGKLTTPATDAILSLAAAPVLMMNNEMSNLRFRRGELKTSTEGYNTWGRLLTGKDEVNAGYAQFDLKQTGFELGADKRFETSRGQVFVGLSGNYSNGDVKHKRGGTSNSDSYGVGAHATYFDQTGLYVDGLLKFNTYSNDLRAVSTNGLSVRGDYKQGAFGAAFEVGYNTNLTPTVWVEPYAKLSYVQAEGKDVLLNNGMSANIGAQKSLATELGASIGKDFKVNAKSTISPYAKLAWAHEFQGGNETTINRIHRFESNLSGDVGKIGLGVNANLLGDALNIYGEFDYAQGKKVDSPFKFNVGLRYAF